MIFNIPLGGKRIALATIYGAPGETVTLTPAKGDPIESTMNANGIGDVKEIPVGVYIVTGSTSKEILTSGRTVVVDKNTTAVTAYPPGAIFWFGNGDADGDSLYAGAYSYYGGYVPSGKTGANGYGEKTTGDNTVGASCSCPSSAGSTYGGTTFSPSISLSGYSYVNVYGQCYSTSKAAFGFPSTHAESSSNNIKYWPTDMYVKPTQTSYQIYSMAVPSSQTSGYLAVSVFGCTYSSTWASATIKAAWRDTTNALPIGELATRANSIDVGSSTYRYGTGCASYWGQAQAYSTENYFGQSSGGYNIALINLGSFSIPSGATPTRLQLSFYGYRSSQSYTCWAICTSKSNLSLYGSGGETGVVGEFDGDDTQIAMGTVSLASFTSSEYTTLSLSFKTDAIPSGTPLYLYLWPSDQGANGVSHITRYLTAKVWYTYEE